MPLNLDMCRMQSTSTGIGNTITLDAVVDGFVSFQTELERAVTNAEIVAVDGTEVYVAIEQASTNAAMLREVGRWRYNEGSPATLTRLEIYQSTNSGNAISLEGAAQLFSAPLKEGVGSGSGTGRTQLTADTTVYVDPSGDDEDGDGSIGNPFKTIQRGANHIMYEVIGRNVRVRLKVNDGTYNEQVFLGPHEIFNSDSFSWTDWTAGGPYIEFSSVATPGNVVLAPSSTSVPHSGVIACSNSVWQIRGGVTLTKGTSILENVFAAYDRAELAIYNAEIAIPDAFNYAFDVDDMSTLYFGDLAPNNIKFYSTLGTLVLVDDGAVVNFYPGTDIYFDVDPGLANGLVDAHYGGGCSVIFRNTWSGVTPATPGPSLIRTGSNVVDVNQLLPESAYSLDYLNSWYNSGTGLIHFIKPGSGSVFWEIGTESNNAGAIPGDMYFWDYTQDLVPLSMGTIAGSPGTALNRTFATGMWCWTDHAKYGGGGTVDTALSRTRDGGVIAVGSGATVGDTSGWVEAASVLYVPTAIAGLFSPAVAGQICAINDGDPGLTNGQTPVNSGAGATEYLVAYLNGGWVIVV